MNDIAVIVKDLMALSIQKKVTISTAESCTGGLLAYSFTKNMRRFLNFNKNQLKKLSSNSQKCFDENFNLLSKKNSLSELIKKDLKNANIQKNII